MMALAYMNDVSFQRDNALLKFINSWARVNFGPLVGLHKRKIDIIKNNIVSLYNVLFLTCQSKSTQYIHAYLQL